MKHDHTEIRTLGGRIRRFRELRGLSQKELGVKCGYPEQSAAVRICGYENNKDLPRDPNGLKAVAKALEINEAALYITDYSLEDTIPLMHMLFDLQDIYGISPKPHDKKEKTYTLRTEDNEVNAFLKVWTDKYEEVRTGHLSLKEYEEWKAAFPTSEDLLDLDIAKTEFDIMQLKKKQEELQNQLKDLNTEE